MSGCTVNLACLAGTLAFASPEPAAGTSEGYLLVRRDRDIRTVHLVEIDDRTLVHGDADRLWVHVPLDQCVALLANDALAPTPHTGVLRLVDGQRFPGEALSGARSLDDVLVWNQSAWLGRMEVPLERIESIVFSAGEDVPAPGDEDVVILVNGDRLDGLVTALGDPIAIEVESEQPGGERLTLEVPLDRVAAVRMITPRTVASGTRLWLVDGTVVDVNRVVVGDDGLVRLDGLPYVAEIDAERLELSSLVAVRFDADALVPLAELRTARVKGPGLRYQVRPPESLDGLAPLGLSRIELQGPISVSYSLPTVPVFLSAEAELPVSARSWGDCELLIRDGRNEVFRARLNGETPTVTIGVELRSSHLEIEITEGDNGPIQDRVILHRAMLLK